MKVEDTKIQGVKIIHLDIYGDERGFFVERFNADKFKELGLPTDFKQDNHSRSTSGVIRGLHYQHTPPQGKLVGAAKGSIWDVAVDIRENSPTYGEYVGEILNDTNGKLLWMEAGLAHGFAVLGDEITDVFYKCTETFNAEGEEGISWNDPTLNIAWPFEKMTLTGDKPIISARDQDQQSFSDFQESPIKWK